MKRRYLIVMAVLLFFVYIRLTRDYDRVVYTSPDLIFYETTLKGLEDRASAIVRGRLHDDAATVFSRQSANPLYSVATLDILEVFKGDLELGGRIKIIEPYFIRRRELWTKNNYLPSIPNREYIFFLGHQASALAPEGSEGAHFVIHQERGRYLVPDKGQTNVEGFSRKELSLGKLDTDLYMSLYQDVIDVYLAD